MPDLARVRIALGGWTGAPGVITEHYSQGSTSWTDSSIQDLVNEVRTRYAASTAVFISGVTLTVEPAVGIFDAATAELVNVITAATPPAVITGTGAVSKESRATQLGVRLLTNDFRYGRRIQGRSFWGPINSDALGTDGNITPTIRTDVAGFYAASISGLGPRLCVYSRPNEALGRAGDYADVTGVTVSIKPFILRSRRD